LKSVQVSAAALTLQVKRNDAELSAARYELGVVTAQASSHLEHLRTREWRRGFDENLFRELDAEMGAAQMGQGALQAEHDQLRQQSAELASKLAARDEAIGNLQTAAAAAAAAQSRYAGELKERESTGAALNSQIAALESERARLHAALAARDAAAAEARTAAVEAAQRAAELLESAAKNQAELAARAAQLEADGETREQGMAVLMAHLQEARRPIQSIEADVKRLTDELAAKTTALDQLNEGNRTLRATLERTRGALEEREFLIRRLERSESNNANVLGRIQTSIERLGTPPAAGTGSGVPGGSGAPGVGPGAAAPMECVAEFIRIDGERSTAHPLGRRTRIGRAPGCEVQVDSSSVSRNHALVLMGARDVIIEDLNSTNGVIVNGRKISRQLLNDGDLIVIGEVQFRLAVRLAPRMLEAPAHEPR
jgi:predicted  nucleic acid-binding Zn-ribbon protein